MAFGNGIPVAMGFDLGSAIPLDSRTLFDSEDDMRKFGADHPDCIPIGLLVSVRDSLKVYIWNGDEFRDIFEDNISSNVSWDTIKALFSDHGINISDDGNISTKGTIDGSNLVTVERSK